MIALNEEQELNNGQPSLHVLCIAALDLQEGNHVVHIGSGAGYYTAILAKMVGESGLIDAYEICPEFVRRAESNLKDLPKSRSMRLLALNRAYRLAMRFMSTPVRLSL